MTQPSALSPLDNLWIDALADARRVYDRSYIREIWETTELVEVVHPRVAFQLVYRPPTVAGREVCEIPRITMLPAIESRELLLYVIHERALALGEKEVSTLLGCLPRQTANIAERWRKLACIRDIATLPYYGLEDRPTCKICGGRVATGAGYKPGSIPLDTGNKPLTAFAHYRPDLHHECKNFAMTVLMPRHRAAQVEAARKAAEEVDK